MIKNFLAYLGIDKTKGIHSVAPAQRRKHARYPGYRAEVVMGNRTCGIRDWSLGGLAFDPGADSRIQAGDRLQLTLKFHLPQGTVTIEQPALIIRASRRGGVAATFAPLQPSVRRQFDRVLDSLHAQTFLESQAA